MVVHYKRLDIDTAFAFDAALELDSTVYVSKLAQPVGIATAPLRLAEMDDAFATLTLDDDSGLAFFRAVEARVVAECVARKAEWFKGDLSDEDIAAHLHSFVNDEERTVRVRVSPDLDCFDARSQRIDTPECPVLVRAVLEASRITLGRTEYGLIWTLRQIKVADDCLVPCEDPEPEPELCATPSVLANDSEGLDDVIA